METTASLDWILASTAAAILVGGLFLLFDGITGSRAEPSVTANPHILVTPLATLGNRLLL